MRFGFLQFARELDTVGSLAQLGEQQGFELIGFADSPALIHDPYVALTLAATKTTRVRLGPAVTNLQTRHPLIIANLAASLERLAPGRSFLGLGTGFSGVRHAGARPSTLAGLERGVATIQGLLAGATVEADGGQINLRLAPAQIPLLLAGSGPKSLRLAGQLADIVFLAVGIDPEVVTQALRWVREGAEAAGRDPTTIECWAYVDAAIAAERESALDEVTGAAVARATIVFGGPALQSLPPPLREKVVQLVREYDFSQHFLPGRSANYLLAERLGIAEELLARFPVAGTPDDCRRQLETLRAAGIENVCLNLGIVRDVAGALRLFGEQVLPAMGR
jgi:alkanesulfonate monooxygenase SsuD/methylene tetrahydromethanopterin reductase-like flavin-dependent oxidoreductase (luciferase family)